MSLHENRDNPVLMHIEYPGAPWLAIDCHATGATGECGHPLAECPDPGCPGSMCPACGPYRCPSCEELSRRVHALLVDGLREAA